MTEKISLEEYAKPTLDELGSILDLTAGLFQLDDDSPSAGHLNCNGGN